MIIGDAQTFAIGAVATIATVFSLFVSIFWMVVGWRAMRAHEKIADELSTSRYQGANSAATATPDSVPIKKTCNMCKGSGECYCIRKGPGTADDCRRCAGTGKCTHCGGVGDI